MRLFLFPVLLALLLPGGAMAQLLGNTEDPSASFTMGASPEYPTPHSKATLSFVSSFLNLANATVSVSVDGKEIYTGAVHPVSVTLGRAGKAVEVTATVSYNGSEYTQTLTLRPQDVVLVAEPLASAPVLYPGKPRIPLEGTVRVVAIANVRNSQGAVINPAALSYAWKVDETQLIPSSGIGKTAIVVSSPPQHRGREVSVVITNADATLTGGASLSILSEEPSVRVYENDPLLGIRYDRALSGRYAIGSTESTLFAAPFSFPTKGGQPTIEWFLNGSFAQSGSSITLRPSGSGGGTASLSVVASFGDYLKATSILPLSFGQTPRTNFFGL